MWKQCRYQFKVARERLILLWIHLLCIFACRLYQSVISDIIFHSVTNISMCWSAAVFAFNDIHVDYQLCEYWYTYNQNGPLNGPKENTLKDIQHIKWMSELAIVQSVVIAMQRMRKMSAKFIAATNVCVLLWLTSLTMNQLMELRMRKLKQLNYKLNACFVLNLGFRTNPKKKKDIKANFNHRSVR